MCLDNVPGLTHLLKQKKTFTVSSSTSECDIVIGGMKDTLPGLQTSECWYADVVI